MSEYQRPKLILYVIKSGTLYATFCSDRQWYLTGRPDASAAAETPPSQNELELIAKSIGVDSLELKVCKWEIDETESKPSPLDWSIFQSTSIAKNEENDS